MAPRKDLGRAYASDGPCTQVRGSVCVHHFGDDWKEEVLPMGVDESRRQTSEKSVSVQ